MNELADWNQEWLNKIITKQGKQRRRIQLNFEACSFDDFGVNVLFEVLEKWPEANHISGISILL